MDIQPGDNYIHLAFKDRTLLSKILAVVYRVFRLLYVSFYFYFLPFAALLWQFFIPYFVNLLRDENSVALDPETN